MTALLLNLVAGAVMKCWADGWEAYGSGAVDPPTNGAALSQAYRACIDGAGAAS